MFDPQNAQAPYLNTPEVLRHAVIPINPVELVGALMSFVRMLPTIPMRHSVAMSVLMELGARC